MLNAEPRQTEEIKPVPVDLSSLASVADVLDDPIYIVAVPSDPDDHFRFAHANPAFCRICGRDRETLVGHRPQEPFGAIDGDAMAERWRKACVHRTPVHYTVFVDNKVVRSSLTPILDEEGCCRYLVIITRTHGEIQEASKRLEAVLARTSDGVALLGADRRVTEVILGDVDTWGRRPETVIGLELSDLFDGEEQDILHEIWSPDNRSARTIKAELRTRTGAGSVRWAEVTVSNLFDDPSVKAVVLSTRDCTNRRLTRIQLEEAQERLGTLITNASDALIGVDVDHEIVVWNRAAGDMFGYAEEEVLGSDLAVLLPDGVRKHHRDLVTSFVGEAIQRRSVHTRETSILEAVRRDGTVFPVEIGLAKVPSPEGLILLASVRDVTKRVEAERAADEARRDLASTQEQLVQAQKLEAIGQLAGGIAHEINTPMQYIGDNAHFLQAAIGRLLKVAEQATRAVTDEATADDLRALAETVEAARLPMIAERAPKAAEDTLAGVENVSRIVAAMKRFSHPGSENMELLDVNDSLLTTMTVCRNEWKYSADIETRLQDDLPMIHGSLGPLNQVWLNLIVNATHAVADRHGDDKGHITITTGTTDDGQAVQVSIADDGIGIPADELHRVFEQFFTTKEVGRGTGQGLSIAHQVVVDEHHGSIDVESTVGEGTTFTVTLPLEHEPTGETGEAGEA